MLLRMAWRNIGRKTRRTALTVAALSVGTAALVFTHAYAESSYAMMIDVVTRGYLGQMQIHGKGYNDDPDLYTTVPHPEAVERRLADVLPGATASRRVTGVALAAGDDRSSGAIVLGIQPERERASTRLVHIVRGHELSAYPAHEALLADSLAKRLRVTLGADLLLLGQAADGSIANDVYTVVGTTGGAASVELAEGTVFLNLADAQDLFALDGRVHQIVVNLDDGLEPREAAATLREALQAQWSDLEVMSWNEMFPELEIGIEADRKGTYAMDVIILLIVVLGVFNTMTMATYERIRELGILQSIGMSGGRVVALILSEALFLGLIGLGLGLALGAAITYGIGSIDYSAFEGADILGVQMPRELVLRVSPLALVAPSLTTVVTCLLGGLWPALKASRLQPAAAVRHR